MAGERGRFGAPPYEKLMGLDLNIDNLIGAGRQSQPISVLVKRELTSADLGILAVTERNIKPQPLQALTDRHHLLARIIAMGRKDIEAAAITGYTQARISSLKSDPAFKELVSLYREAVDEQFIDVAEHMAGLSRDVILTLRDRLEGDPDSFDIKALTSIAELTLDRTGFGKTQTVETNVNITMATRLEEARKRAKAIARGDIIDGEIIND